MHYLVVATATKQCSSCGQEASDATDACYSSSVGCIRGLRSLGRLIGAFLLASCLVVSSSGCLGALGCALITVVVGSCTLVAVIVSLRRFVLYIEGVVGNVLVNGLSEVDLVEVFAVITQGGRPALEGVTRIGRISGLGCSCALLDLLSVRGLVEVVNKLNGYLLGRSRSSFVHCIYVDAIAGYRCVSRNRYGAFVVSPAPTSELLTLGSVLLSKIGISIELVKQVCALFKCRRSLRSGFVPTVVNVYLMGSNFLVHCVNSKVGTNRGAGVERNKTYRLRTCPNR